VGVLAAYLVLTLAMTWPLVANWTTAIPGDSFDGWQNYWNLWWTKIALVDGVSSPFATDLLYFPTGVNLYFHTLNLFNGLWSLPIQLAWGLIPAYNGVVVFSFTLAGYGAFLLARWVIGEASAWAWCAAFVAGLVFTFAPFHMAHLLGHMQVLSYEWLPFYALFLLRAMSQRQAGRAWLRAALLATLCLVLTGLCDWYFVLYLAFFTAAAMLFWRRARPDAPLLWTKRLLANATVTLVVAGGFILALSPVLIPMMREAVAFSFMVRPAHDLYILSASAADFLIPNRMHAFFRPESFTWPGNQIAPVSERTLSVGFLALALAVVAVIGLRRQAFFWAGCAVFFFFMALGPVIHWGNITWESIPTSPALAEWTPYTVVNWLTPFMRISRSVSRFALMVQLCAAVLAGLGAYWLLTTVERKWRLRTSSSAPVPIRYFLASVFFLSLLLFFEYWVAPYPLSPPDTPSYYQTLAGQPVDGARPAVLNLPMNYDRPGYLLYQTVHGRPLTVAYISRDDPRTLTERAPLLQHLRHLGPDILDVDPGFVGQTVLADLGVGVVVLDRYKMPGGEEREYTERLARQVFANRQPDYEDERITVYRVAAPEQPHPYPLLGPLHWGPLQIAEDGAVIGRRVGREPAGLSLRHAVGDVALRVRYRSAGEVDVLDVSGEMVARLPAEPQGGEAIIPLGALREISFSTSVIDGAIIEKVGVSTYE
jgi:hypothetical protein